MKNFTFPFLELDFINTVSIDFKNVESGQDSNENSEMEEDAYGESEDAYGESEDAYGESDEEAETDVLKNETKTVDIFFS